MSNPSTRAPGLPTYIDCPKCDGTGRITVEVHSARCECHGRGGSCPGGREERIDCDARDCLDGTLICAECQSEKRPVKVVNPGPNYLIPTAAVRWDEYNEEGLCAFHYDLLETEPVSVVGAEEPSEAA